ncbi:DUF1360 domain-containing protein [Halalkalibacterium halodurans]|uniref:Sporulation protein n=1 Tax=Halalkalibacterium halodurans TaxID=86665 RepID=A0A0M0KIE4_ALKHA|nr:DUF1360 domain-containing protein [Halalkalibacterium halodurans]TPE67130.1 DUF1360 domain-containing protein [Halalkalibacterium halodurans]
MLISALELVILSLATFRLTHLIVFDEIFEWVRGLFLTTYEKKDEQGQEYLLVEPKGRGVRKFIGKIISCYWCTGIWMAAFLLTGFFLWPTTFTFFTIFLAIAGIASFLEAIVQRMGM